MITPFNRVRLLEDSSAEAVANVRDALKAGDIPYTMTTRQSRGAFGKVITAGGGVRTYQGGMAASAFSDRVSYVYAIYVRRRDEARARDTIGRNREEGMP